MMVRMMVMVLSSLLFTLSLDSVSACDFDCSDKPVFTPSALVVKYGDPASATCTVCENECLGNLFSLEIPLGLKTENETSLIWTVPKMTEWKTSAICFYNKDNGNQCCISLPVTVYQPPENVSIAVVNHTGPMCEHEEYTLQCTVEDVFPVELLNVTFFRDQEVIGVFKSNYKKQDSPVTEKFMMDISASEEADGAQYWCMAQLELGHVGPQPPPVSLSQALIATVYYGPYLKVPGNPDSITITKGDTLQLNCSSVGNPLPEYNWQLPSATPSSHNSSIFTITSAGFEHGGRYSCNVTSNSKVVTVNFNVEVRGDYIPIIIAATIIGVVLCVCGVVIGYIFQYKKTKMRNYNLQEVFRFHLRHNPVPVNE